MRADGPQNEARQNGKGITDLILLEALGEASLVLEMPLLLGLWLVPLSEG